MYVNQTDITTRVSVSCTLGVMLISRPICRTLYRGERIDAWGHLYQRGPFPTLGSFDKKSVNVFVTEPLVDSLAYIGFAVNDYYLIGVDRVDFLSSEELFERRLERDVEWFEEIEEDERAVRWTELHIRGPDAEIPWDSDNPPFMLQRTIPWDISYDLYTPIKSE